MDLFSRWSVRQGVDVSQHHNNTGINTEPTNVDYIPVSQSQVDPTPTDITNPTIQPPPSTNMIQNTSTSDTYMNNNLPPPEKLVRVYHDNEIQYILADYCQPIQESFTENPPDLCKYNRECLVSKNKVITKAPLKNSLSDTVFGTVPLCKKK